MLYTDTRKLATKYHLPTIDTIMQSELQASKSLPEIGAPRNLKTSIDANEPQMGARHASIIPEQGLEMRAVI